MTLDYFYDYYDYDNENYEGKHYCDLDTGTPSLFKTATVIISTTATPKEISARL